MTDFEWKGARGDKWLASLDGFEAMLAPIDEPLLEAAQLNAARGKVCDVACGGGKTTVEIARRLSSSSSSSSSVTGVDISPALIEAAKKRAAASQTKNISFMTIDVGTSAPPEPFDRVVSRFGVMFFDDPPAAFRSLRDKWLAPGGRFAFAVWGPPRDNAWFPILKDVATAVTGEEPAPPPPDAPGPFRYADVEPFLTLLRDAGFDDVASKEWRGELALGGGLSPNKAAEFALGAFPMLDPVHAAGDDAREKARALLEARFAKHEKDGVVRMAACVPIITGSRL